MGFLPQRLFPKIFLDVLNMDNMLLLLLMMTKHVFTCTTAINLAG